MKLSNIKLSQDGLYIRRLPWLSLGAREIYYDDIAHIEQISLNGRSGPSITLEFKDGHEIRLGLSSEDEVKRLKVELEEIIRPKVIRDENPFAFDRFGGICKELVESRGSNIRKVADFLISQGICHCASDIHMEYSGDDLQVFFKIDGVLFLVVTFERAIGERLINCIKVTAGMILYRRDTIQEGRITQITNEGAQDLRVSVLPSEPGERIVIRMFDKLKSESGLEDLGFSHEILKELKRLVAAPQGFFIIGGPAGSGKTTTLYALLRHMKAVRGHLASIITLEDPVEYRIAGITQVQINPKGKLTFAGALKSSLRQDPGVIMVGEIRDKETADAAVRAALTGHLVLSSVHCGSSAEAITRLLDLGVRPFLLNSSLKGVVCQRLIRKVCPECVSNIEMGQDEWNLGDSKTMPDSYVQGAGCGECRGTGYRGRTVIAEFLENRDGIGHLINNTSETEAIEKAAVAQGMIPLHKNGIRMVLEGVTDPKEIKRVVG